MKTKSRKSFSTVVLIAISLMANVTPASAEVRIGFGVFQNQSAVQSGVDRENAAIDLYNRGVDELNSKNYSQATKTFRECLQVNPALVPAHEVLGRAYYEMKEFDKAICELQFALRNNSRRGEILYFAGDSLAQTGNYTDAVEYLKSYLHSSRDREYLEDAQRELSVIEHQYLAKPDGDYFAAATKEGACFWPAEAMPLRVFINESTKAKGYRPEFANGLRQSFKDWADISQNKISFVFTKDSANADITCDWSDDVTKFGDTQELGLTNVLISGETGAIRSAEISLFSFIDKGSRTSEALLRTAKSVQLHEIGHALGLGHSNCDYDVMFPLTSPEGLEFPLNTRDGNTIGMLYRDLKSKPMANSNCSSTQSLLRKE
jgi:tetratricopeptide (TPR) repeat protein